jgi:MFS family permease
MSAGRNDAPARAVTSRNAFVGAYLGWMFDGYETFATVLIASYLVNDLVGPGTAARSPLYIGTLLATTLVAWAVGGLVSGVLADRFGRRRVLMISILWYAVFAGLTAFSPNFGVYLVLRFLTGLGMGAEWGGGSSLVAETSAPRSRGRRIAVLQGAFGVGFLVATGAWELINQGGADDWRWMYAVGVVPALLVLFIRRSVEDSEMWKAVDRNRRKAQSRLLSGDPVSERARQLTRPTIRQLLGDPTYRWQCGRLLVGALATMCGWWAVSTWIPTFAAAILKGRVSDLGGGVTLVVVAYNLAGVGGYLAMGWLADIIGRKAVMTLYFAASLLLTPVFFLFAHTLTAMIGLAALNGVFTLGQMTWLALYPGELFPTHLRATAISAVFNLARFPAAIGAMLTPLLIGGFGSVATAAIVIGCCAYALGLLISPFIGPETRGAPLPQVDLSDRAPAV